MLTRGLCEAWFGGRRALVSEAGGGGACFSRRDPEAIGDTFLVVAARGQAGERNLGKQVRVGITE